MLNFRFHTMPVVWFWGKPLEIPGLQWMVMFLLRLKACGPFKIWFVCMRVGWACGGHCGDYKQIYLLSSHDQLYIWMLMVCGEPPHSPFYHLPDPSSIIPLQLNSFTTEPLHTTITVFYQMNAAGMETDKPLNLSDSNEIQSYRGQKTKVSRRIHLGVYLAKYGMPGSVEWTWFGVMIFMEWVWLF